MMLFGLTLSKDYENENELFGPCNAFVYELEILDMSVTSIHHCQSKLLAFE